MRPRAAFLAAALAALALAGCGGSGGSSTSAGQSHYEGGEKSIEDFGSEAEGSDRAALLGDPAQAARPHRRGDRP